MPRCRNCKEKFEQYEFNNKFCKKQDCQVAKALFNLDKIKKQKNKDWKERKRKLKPKVYSKKYKAQLQSEINKLARNIDAYFNLPCIDCGKPFTSQIDGAHFHNVGGNEHLRFNLHNIHSARAHCNQHDSEHKKRYPNGLKQRYGADYLEYVQFGLRNDYKELKLTEQEIYDKLKIVRKLNREFTTFTLTDPIGARNYFNRIIGIYKDND